MEERGGRAMQEQAVEQREIMKVMVAIDENDESLHALNWAIDNLLRSMGIVPGILYLAHVQPPAMHYLFPAGSAAVTESLERAQHQNSAAIISRALSTCKDKMVKAESMILSGDPKEKICSVVESMGIDLLVTGSRGRNALKRAVLGSVSDYCAHHANCPVLIVKRPGEVGDKPATEGLE